MNAADVVTLLGRLEQAGIPVWVAGGWAVDALVGRQTREHSDLDLAVDSAYLGAVIALAEDEGYETTVDELPARVALSAAGDRAIDLHPVVFATDGSGAQAGHDGAVFSYPADGFEIGTIDGTRVPCLGARLQLSFREGYEAREVDRHDVALLHEVLAALD